MMLSSALAGDTLLVARGVAESWNDAAIGSVYANGALMGGAGVVVDLFGPVAVDVELAYRRLDAASGNETQRFEMLPVTLLGEFTFPAPAAPLDPFLGIGFTFATWTERHAPDTTGATVTRGMRPSIEVRAGIRFDLGLIQPTMMGNPVIKGLDLEVFGARRFQMPGGEGFDLAAWRGGLGLALRL